MRLTYACVFAVAIYGLSVAHAAGQNAPTLGLEQAVKSALESHPLVRSARLGTEQAANRSAEAKAERVPKFRLSETLNRSNNPVFVFGSLLEQSRFGVENFALPALNNPAPITNLRTVLSTSVPLFDGMKTSARIELSALAGRQASRLEESAAQRVRVEVIQHYFGALVAQAAVGVAEQASRTAESDVKRAKDRKDAGLAVESDLLAAQVQLAEFAQERIHAEGELATALALLNISIGAQPDEPRTLTVALSKKDFDVAAPDQLIERALRHRPEFQNAETGIEAARRRVTERRSEYFPELNVFGSIGSSGRNLVTGSADYTVGATVSVNLFDRGRPARIGQALVDERLAKTESDRIADQIRGDVIRAYHRYRAAEQRIAVTEAALSQATEGLRIIQDRYDAGLATITDVLRAETALVRTRMNVVLSLYDQHIGYANLLFSTGELVDVKAFEP